MSATGILRLLRDLDVQARKAGGAVYMLNGNHESLNVCGDFRCAFSLPRRQLLQAQHSGPVQCSGLLIRADAGCNLGSSTGSCQLQSRAAAVGVAAAGGAALCSSCHGLYPRPAVAALSGRQLP